jgi:hypothetical protein
MSIRRSITVLALSLALPGLSFAGQQISGAFDNTLTDSELTDNDQLSDDDQVSTGGALYDDISNSFNETDNSVDASLHSKNSFNTDNSFNVSNNVLAFPVAAGVLLGSVTGNTVIVAALATTGATASAYADTYVTLSDNALQGFTGVNSMNVNAGANSLQQSNVSIAVVSVGAP